MHGDTRPLYYVGRQLPAPLKACLQERSWEVKEIEPGARVTHRSASAGILELTSLYLPSELRHLHEFLSNSLIGWVALGYREDFEDESVRRLIRDYCFDYVTLPTSNDRVVDAVGHAYGMVALHENASNDARDGRAEGEMVGSCDAMLALFRSIRKVAMTDAPVFISGESGTGKELIARAIHYNSGRRGKFVSINCGALPENLLESELFGHERGAFTGAIREKRGLFQEADRGTIFLDEIGETSTAMQIKLLRVLQDRVVRKVGSNTETQVEVRVIAATNRDLSESIKNGTFREDLFYRINVIPIALPALRQRKEDIPLLVEHFIAKYCANLGVPQKHISADAMRAIEKYQWPGNVRELENVVERMIALEASEVLTTKSLPEAVLLGGSIPDVTFDLPPDGISLQDHLEAIGKIFMMKALERSGGVQTQAAELLRMSFRSFRYYAKKYDLIPREGKQEDVVEVENEK